MWDTMEFKSQAAMDRFLNKNRNKIQYEIIYINNGFAIEYRKLRRIL